MDTGVAGGSAGVKSCGHGSGWGQRGSNHVATGVGVSGGQIMLTREWLGVSGGQIMLTQEWLGVSGGQIMWTREWLAVRGSNHVDTEVAGGQRGSGPRIILSIDPLYSEYYELRTPTVPVWGIMLSFKWLGVSGGQVAGGQRGSNHVVLKWLGVSGGQIMLSFKWLGVSGGQVAGGQRGSSGWGSAGVKSCCPSSDWGSAGARSPNHPVHRPVVV